MGKFVFVIACILRACFLKKLLLPRSIISSCQTA